MHTFYAKPVPIGMELDGNVFFKFSLNVVFAVFPAEWATQDFHNSILLFAFFDHGVGKLECSFGVCFKFFTNAESNAIWIF